MPAFAATGILFLLCKPFCFPLFHLQVCGLRNVLMKYNDDKVEGVLQRTTRTEGPEC